MCGIFVVAKATNMVTSQAINSDKKNIRHPFFLVVSGHLLLPYLRQTICYQHAGIPIVVSSVPISDILRDWLGIIEVSILFNTIRHFLIGQSLKVINKKLSAFRNTAKNVLPYGVSYALFRTNLFVLI